MNMSSDRWIPPPAAPYLIVTNKRRIPVHCHGWEAMAEEARALKLEPGEHILQVWLSVPVPRV